MRPKIVAAILLIGLAVIFAVIIERPVAGQNQAVAPAVQPASPPEMAKTISTSNSEAPAKQPIAAVHKNTGTNGLSGHDLYVHEHLVKLARLQANDDAESLHEILSDLTNSDKKIRAAALVSTIQFSSRD